VPIQEWREIAQDESYSPASQFYQQQGVKRQGAVMPDDDQMQEQYCHRTAEFSSQPLNVTDEYSMADFFQWCAHNHKKPTQDSLVEFAAVSGMNVENYIDIYLFLDENR